MKIARRCRIVRSTSEQQVVTPVKHRAQGTVPRQGCTTATGQQPEAIIEPRDHLVDPKRCGSGGGEFEGQRYAVQAPADRDRRREICRA